MAVQLLSMPSTTCLRATERDFNKQSTAPSRVYSPEHRQKRKEIKDKIQSILMLYVIQVCDMSHDGPGATELYRNAKNKAKPSSCSASASTPRRVYDEAQGNTTAAQQRK